MQFRKIAQTVEKGYTRVLLKFKSTKEAKEAVTRFYDTEFKDAEIIAFYDVGTYVTFYVGAQETADEIVKFLRKAK